MGIVSSTRLGERKNYFWWFAWSQWICDLVGVGRCPASHSNHYPYSWCRRGLRSIDRRAVFKIECNCFAAAVWARPMPMDFLSVGASRQNRRPVPLFPVLTDASDAQELDVSCSYIRRPRGRSLARRRGHSRCGQALEFSEIVSGTAFSKIDKVVVRAIPQNAALDGLVAGLMYAGLHDAGTQVWAGCGNWLFLADELRSTRRDLDNISVRAKLYLLIAAELKRRGILLVVLPVPDKAGQLENKLCGLSADASRLRSRAWARLKSPR